MGRTIEHGEPEWSEGGGVMYGSVGTGTGTMPQPDPAGQPLYVVTEAPDAGYRRAIEAGSRIVREPYETDHGSRNVTPADPEGNIWTFGTYRGA